MSRLVNNTAILAKIETTYGTDAAPSGAANALLISNQKINPLVAQNADRNVMRPYLGNSESLVGTRYKQLDFDVELVGSGTAGTAPALGPLLRACGFAETITASVRVDYNPISGGYESLSIYYYDDGALHKLLGARGSFKLSAQVGEIPKLSFSFIGLDGGDSAAPLPSVTLDAWRVPQTVVDANSGDLTFGCTHSITGAPALVGGTAFPSEGINIDSGISAPFNALLGGETVPITERKVTADMKMDLSAVDEVALLTAVKATALTSLGFVHGTVVGDRALIFMPSVQRTDPTKEEKNGMRMIGTKLRVNPKLGNDELRFVFF